MNTTVIDKIYLVNISAGSFKNAAYRFTKSIVADMSKVFLTSLQK